MPFQVSVSQLLLKQWKKVFQTSGSAIQIRRMLAYHLHLLRNEEVMFVNIIKTNVLFYIHITKIQILIYSSHQNLFDLQYLNFLWRNSKSILIGTIVYLHCLGTYCCAPENV